MRMKQKKRKILLAGYRKQAADLERVSHYIKSLSIISLWMYSTLSPLFHYLLNESVVFRQIWEEIKAFSLFCRFLEGKNGLQYCIWKMGDREWVIWLEKKSWGAMGCLIYVNFIVCLTLCCAYKTQWHEILQTPAEPTGVCNVCFLGRLSHKNIFENEKNVFSQHFLMCEWVLYPQITLWYVISLFRNFLWFSVWLLLAKSPASALYSISHEHAFFWRKIL